MNRHRKKIKIKAIAGSAQRRPDGLQEPFENSRQYAKGYEIRS
jgi:hypothetical protein